MAIVGDRPESGVRIVLERPRQPAEAPWTYEGFAHTPEASIPVRVRVTEAGEVTVEAEPPFPVGERLAEKVRLLVRAVHKQAAADGEPPPLRITRWRGAK